MPIFSDDIKKLDPSRWQRFYWFLVGTNFQHRLTDLHLSKLIMTMLTFGDVSKFASVNPAIDDQAYIYDQKFNCSRQTY